MLTLQGFFPQGCRMIGKRLHSWQLPVVLLSGLACVVPSDSVAQQGPVYTQDSPVFVQGQQIQYGPSLSSGQAFQIPVGSQPRRQPTGFIQQVQNTPQSARAMHRLIESMPQPQDEIEVIQQRHQLVLMRSNISRISIGDASIVDVVQYGPREIAIVGGVRGSTSLTFWFEGEADPLIYTVRTIRDPNLDNQRKLDYGKLERKLALMYPNSKVYLIPMGFKIIVRGQVRDSEEASHILNVVRGEVMNQDGAAFGPQPYLNGAGFGGASSGGYAAGAGGSGGYGSPFGFNVWDMAAGLIINELKVPGEFQIALRVRIAELNRSMADRAGVDINVLFNDARHAITSTLGAGAGTIGGVFENGEIGLFLDYLCQNGTTKILSEPTMTTLSGREAQFLAGGEYAVQSVVGVGAGASTSTNFRGFGTSLRATPTITDRDLIRLEITAEYSDLNSSNNSGGNLGTSNRRIRTTVELREGQTLALAGLLSHRMKTEVSRIPVLGDIPKIGPLLFSSKRTSEEENELLILVTPELVRAMDAHEVPPVPGFEVTRPTHEEFWKYNMTEGQPDTGHYHLPPFGSGSVGTNVDYQHFNPGPAGSMYQPMPTGGNGVRGGGMVSPASTPTPQPSNRLYPVPQASNGTRQGGSQYSNQVMSPNNSGGISQAGWNQSGNQQQRQQSSQQEQRRY